MANFNSLDKYFLRYLKGDITCPDIIKRELHDGNEWKERQIYDYFNREKKKLGLIIPEKVTDLQQITKSLLTNKGKELEKIVVNSISSLNQVSQAIHNKLENDISVKDISDLTNSLSKLVDTSNKLFGLGLNARQPNVDIKEVGNLQINNNTAQEPKKEIRDIQDSEFEFIE